MIILLWWLVATFAFLGAVFFVAFIYQRRCRARREVWLEEFSKRLDAREVFSSKIRYQFFSCMRQDWYIRGNHRNKRFEIFSASRQVGGIGRGYVVIRCLWPDISKHIDLKFSVESRQWMQCWRDIWNKNRVIFGDKSLDSRLVFRCNDSLFFRHLRNFGELHHALLDACPPHKKRWSLFFKNGSLKSIMETSQLKKTLMDEIMAIVGLCCDVCDLIQSREWIALTQVNEWEGIK